MAGERAEAPSEQPLRLRHQLAELVEGCQGHFEPIERDLSPVMAVVWALCETTFKGACVMDWTQEQATMKLLGQRPRRPFSVTLASFRRLAIPIAIIALLYPLHTRAVIFITSHGLSIG